MFYDNLVALCVKYNTTPSRVAIAIGLNKSSASNWKKTGQLPTDVNLQKLADYFSVSVDFLLNGTQPETEKSQPAEIDKLANSEIKKKLVEYFDTLPEEKLVALLALIKPTDN